MLQSALQCLLLASTLAESTSPVSGIHSSSVREAIGCGEKVSLEECFSKQARVLGGDKSLKITESGVIANTDKVKEWKNHSGLRYYPIKKDEHFIVLAEIFGKHDISFILYGLKTGKEVRLDAVPIFSSDAKYFATASYDVDADYLPNRIQIWDATQLTNVYTHDRFQPESGPKAIEWLSGNQLQVYVGKTEDVAYENMDKFTLENGKTWLCRSSKMTLCK